MILKKGGIRKRGRELSQGRKKRGGKRGIVG